MTQRPQLKTVVLGVLVLALILAMAVGGWAGCKSIKRGQQRADAHNQARVEQLKVEAVVARAEQRYQEAVGIKRSQDEINKTLTDRYIQHEAIQAQKEIATSGSNNTVIYVPSGTNGTPTITQAADPETGK